jgi:hypothetical protein
MGIDNTGSKTRGSVAPYGCWCALNIMCMTRGWGGEGDTLGPWGKGGEGGNLPVLFTQQDDDFFLIAKHYIQDPQGERRG